MHPLSAPFRHRAPTRCNGGAAGARGGGARGPASAPCSISTRSSGSGIVSPKTVAQRPAGAVDRLSRAAAAQSQRRGDLLVAQAFELAHHDRGALRLGQVAQALHQLGHLLAAFGLFGRGARAGRERLGQLGGLRPGGRAGR